MYIRLAPSPPLAVGTEARAAGETVPVGLILMRRTVYRVDHRRRAGAEAPEDRWELLVVPAVLVVLGVMGMVPVAVAVVGTQTPPPLPTAVAVAVAAADTGPQSVPLAAQPA